MRLALLALLLGAALSGCAASSDPADDSTPAPVEHVPAGDAELASGKYFLGLPSGPATDVAAIQGVVVPEGRTHLTVVVRIEVGASVGLAATGLPGCDHAYADPQLPTDPLVYECDTEPGDYTLAFRHGGGRIDFTVAVYGRAQP